MWGKWAQNQNKTQTTNVTSEKEFCELLTSPGTEVINLIFPNYDVAWVSWKYSEEHVAARKKVNVAVAAYVTTRAQLKLYEYLTELGESVLYCDRLGNLHPKWMNPKSENRGLSGRPHGRVGGVWPWLLHRRVCVGWPQKLCILFILPLNRKTYNETEVKFITLNYEHSKVLNVTALSSMILEDDTPLHVHNPKKIKRKYSGAVVSVPETKEYKEAPSYGKFLFFPYG
jgi:hypothetical protein